MSASLVAMILDGILTSRFKWEMGLQESGSWGSFPFLESSLMLITRLQVWAAGPYTVINLVESGFYDMLQGFVEFASETIWTGGLRGG